MPSHDATALLITGLKNAHAMENQALSIMRPQLGRIEHYPEVAQRLQSHITETEGQIARLHTILTSLNEDNSVLKDAALSVVGTMAALGHTPAGDEILKNSYANYAFENFEIAAYKSLITMARACDEAGFVPALEQSLMEEQQMAAWLDANLEAVTLRYLSLREAGQTAKR